MVKVCFSFRMWLALPAILFVVAMSYVFQTMPRESDSGMSIGASHRLAGRSGFLLRRLLLCSSCPSRQAAFSGPACLAWHSLH